MSTTVMFCQLCSCERLFNWLQLKGRANGGPGGVSLAACGVCGNVVAVRR